MAGRLVITKPAALRGTAFPLTAARTVIGRSANSDVQVQDSFISQCHAVVLHRDGRAILEDLGSKNGTTINERTVSSPALLQHGDVIRVGRAEMRFEETAGNEQWDVTGLHDAVRDRADRPHPGNFVVDRQSAESLYNIGGDQIVHQIQQRDSFLREIAATKTKATRLIWFGFLLILLGGAAFASMVLGFMSEIWGKIPSAGDPGGFVQPDLSTPTLGGVPVGLLGWAAAAVGGVLVVIGIVLHVVATARRRRVEAAYPALPTSRPPRSP
ncbi:FHA domain-containing protein [Amycolatopsis balhimycina DSM 5908]|uniref:FHA domain-containing protein n=1 Tax=Amycolatopsis balhimycina DSM 5908 TaxID=1081091 RepID=A0A428WTN6_AMYBA|nr:FHA domain-containing protein [Amycolatopsis balhimycina]RSM46412.1 FHA domain-containing protein [Amycolatopsis balhimycina DSM 5908]